MLLRALALLTVLEFTTPAHASLGAYYIKGNLDLDLVELDPFYIQDGQCSGVLNKNDFSCKLAPKFAPSPVTVAVEVRESSLQAGVPSLHLLTAGSKIKIYRSAAPSGRCEGIADVRLWVACPGI